MELQKKWTDQEDQFLRENALNMGHESMAKVLGRTSNAVRGRCSVLKVLKKAGEWTEDEIAMLKNAYLSATSNQTLDLSGLAKRFGRLRSNLSRKARQLGLSDISRKGVEQRKDKNKYDTLEEARAATSRATKERYAKGLHPRGALGMKHTPESLAKISAASIRSNAAITPEMRAAISLKAMKTKVANGTYAPQRQKTTWKAGWREIGGLRKFYRSKWEANYAWYLQWLKEKGQIEDWKHEPKTFWFEGVKRGTVSYLPDFWVLELNGTDSFHEVKGWMDDRSKTKIKRMAKYYPQVKLVVIDSKGYTALAKSVSSLVPGWEK